MKQKFRSNPLLFAANRTPWVNRAGKDIATAPVPVGTYGNAVREFAGKDLTVEDGQSAKIELSLQVDGKLKTWSPGAPNLNGVHVSPTTEHKVIDISTTRFGWREFEIQGKDLLLNSKKIQLAGDLLHPFSPLTMSRRHVSAWYKLIQDFGGNAVRKKSAVHRWVGMGAFESMLAEMGTRVEERKGFSL